MVPVLISSGLSSFFFFGGCSGAGGILSSSFCRLGLDGYVTGLVDPSVLTVSGLGRRRRGGENDRERLLLDLRSSRKGDCNNRCVEGQIYSLINTYSSSRRSTSTSVISIPVTFEPHSLYHFKIDINKARHKTILHSSGTNTIY